MLRFFATVTSSILATALVAAQDMRPAEQVYKNIKVMTGVPANQIIVGMHLMRTALGVECEHCHLPMARDRDDLPTKDKARAMYVMMTGINRANFDGRPVVTCYTCHKGHVTPEDMASLPAPPIKKEETEAKPDLPGADAVLAKYISALGGEAALRRVTTRVITGTQDVPTGPGGSVPTPARLERSLKAPNLVLDVYTADTFTISSGFDGQGQWATTQNGNVTSSTPGGVDAERAARAAAFYEPLTLKQQYRTLTVDGIARISGHDAYLVTGTPAANTPERLYFDTQSGLLLRKWTYIEAMAGRNPYQIDFDDYRNTGSGVKIPFLVHMSPAGTRTELETASTLRITSVKDNVPLDDAKFVKPAPQPAPR